MKRDTLYRKIKAGQWVHFNPHDNRMACCDCGLVHKFEFKLKQVRSGKLDLFYRAWRDEKETKRLRKKRGSTK